MPTKYLPPMRSLKRVKWRRTGLGEKGLLTVKAGAGFAGGAVAGALVAKKVKNKRKKK